MRRIFQRVTSVEFLSRLIVVLVIAAVYVVIATVYVLLWVISPWLAVGVFASGVTVGVINRRTRRRKRLQ